MYSRNEDLVTLAKGSRKLPNFIWATLLVLIFMTGGQIIGGICIVPIYLIMYMTRGVSSDLGLFELFINLSSFLFISVLVFVRVKYIEKRKISTIGFTKDSWLKNMVQAF